MTSLRNFLIFTVCVVLCGPAFAEWNLRDADRILDEIELSDTFEGRVITFYDEGQSVFEFGGRYAYVYESGRTFWGDYELRPEGLICITFENGFDRCDKYVQSADRLVLLTESGDRFPIRDVASVLGSDELD